MKPGLAASRTRTPVSIFPGTRASKATDSMPSRPRRLARFPQPSSRMTTQFTSMARLSPCRPHCPPTAPTGTVPFGAAEDTTRTYGQLPKCPSKSFTSRSACPDLRVSIVRGRLQLFASGAKAACWRKPAPCSPTAPISARSTTRPESSLSSETAFDKTRRIERWRTRQREERPARQYIGIRVSLAGDLQVGKIGDRSSSHPAGNTAIRRRLFEIVDHQRRLLSPLTLQEKRRG